MSDKIYRLTPGINNCTNEQYHGDKSYLSSSNLKLILKDPLQFKIEVIDGKRENKQVNAFDEGSYAHSLILEPENVDKEYAFFDGFRKAGADWEIFKAANEGKILLSKPQKHRVELWVEAYRQRKQAVNLISGGFPEQSLALNYLDIKIKVRADYINIDKGYIADVKTTGYSPDVDTFSHVIASLGYDLSAALYTQMFSQHYGKKFDFYFVVLGKKEISCEVFKASEATLQKGEMMIIDAINKYKKCLKTGIWTNNKTSSILEEDDYEILEV